MLHLGIIDIISEPIILLDSGEIGKYFLIEQGVKDEGERLASLPAASDCTPCRDRWVFHWQSVLPLGRGGRRSGGSCLIKAVPEKTN